MRFRPITGSLNRVVVQPDAPEEVTPSGIQLAPGAVERPMQGKVISVSKENVDGAEPTVKAGDIVIYGKFGVAEISIDNQQYLIMRENDIYGIISPAAAGNP